jgi:hypothetical protein
MNGTSAVRRPAWEGRFAAAPLQARRWQLPSRRWQQWGDAFLNRWARWPAALGPEATFRRSRAGERSSPTFNRFDIAYVLAPVVQLALSRIPSLATQRAEAPARMSLHRPVVAAPRAAIERASWLVAPIAARPAAWTATERLLRRASSLTIERSKLYRYSEQLVASTSVQRDQTLVLRERARDVVEPGAAPRRLLRRAERQLPHDVAPQRLAFRAASAARAAKEDPVPSQPSPWRGRPASATEPAAGLAMPATPPLNIDRLTEQVIERIDRRVVAQRERLGRI